jgi:hypothetical protein
MSPGLRSRRQVWNWRQPLRCRRTVSLVRYRGERSVGPAVNNAVAQCTAAAPPLLRSWHTRLARPGGAGGVPKIQLCSQVMFTSGQTARLTSGSVIPLPFTFGHNCEQPGPRAGLIR